MTPILDVSGLTHRYGGNSPFVHDAVSEVSFSVAPGEIVGIIGHTGSGKSTLIQHLNGLLKPTQGTVFLNGADIWAKPKEIRSVRFAVGLVFQYPEYQLFEETVAADLAFGPKNQGLSPEECDRRVAEICELTGLDRSYLSRSPFDLSGGEKRRVAIAGVMAMRPQVLVFDEPVAGLDPKGRRMVMEMIRTYRDTYGATVLVVSHNMEDMAVLANKLLVMNAGRAVRFDTTERVFSDAAFLQSIGLNVPMVTQIFAELRRRGYRVPENCFTVEAAVAFLTSLRGGDGRA